MAFDYKKEYKEFYVPKDTPAIVTVPKMNYIAVRGSGNPNDEDGEYKQAIGLLSGKLRQRKNRIFLRLSFFPMRRAYVYSVCISDRMTMSLLQYMRCTDLWKNKDMHWILLIRECTTKFI